MHQAMQDLRKRIPSPPLAAVLLMGVLTIGCSYALGPRLLIAGREFPRDQVAQLTRGLSETAVQKHLGEPSARKVTGDAVTLTYRAEYQQRACEVRLFGFIPVERRPRERYTLTLEFGSLGLERALYTAHVEPDPAVTRLLVSSAR